MKDLEIQNKFSGKSGMEAKKIIKLIFAVIFFLLGLILCIGDAMNSGTFEEYKISYLIGRLMGTVVITLIPFFIIKKTKRSFFKFSVILFLVVLFAMIGGSKDWKQSDVNIVINYQKNSIKEMLSGKEIIIQTFDEKTYGKSAAILTAFNKYLVRQNSVIKDLSTKIDEQGFDINKIQTKEFLTNQNSIAEYKKKYNTVFEAFDEFEKEIQDNNTSYQSALAQIDMPSKLKDSLMKDINMEAVNNYCSNYKGIFIDQKNLFDYLINNKNKYIFEGNIIMFKTQASLDEYNKLADKYNNAFDEFTKSQTNKLNNINNMINN